MPKVQTQTTTFETKIHFCLRVMSAELRAPILLEGYLERGGLLVGAQRDAFRGCGPARSARSTALNSSASARASRNAVAGRGFAK